ncbi:hypothetical protein AVEN_111947-1 [Araneus ventricosus]|uniref:RNase H type-1 domain-containing protein n=1 Tax=Araneus ventricosus TaxID=182803 RepID=A0A4Y2QW42_ARAVE|nr:hypothetical protein AVEN_14732-1 [Araneus ventricosus]GBN67650.1 hypothetical protein AVEN_51422-1 [Araneus ventricosus]GBN83236.1 hypothetical protein AVEN_269342-1 [Araneus ventricosus]GBN83246.1 hypothetical protein AVEN_111947-1 [Araneus ventricosus]
MKGPTSSRNNEKASLFALLNIKSKERLVIETLTIFRTLKENHMDIFFTHVKGHCGILGNVRAKECISMPININVGISKCHWKRLSHQKLLVQWEEEYASSSKASHTKKFFPTVKYRLERNSFLVCSFKETQFLTGHGNFGEYLKRFHRQITNVCDCTEREIQNVEHIFRCLRDQDCRKILQQKLDISEKNWPVALINTKFSFLSFTEFVHTCNYI